ncbi:MAG: copper amine oxidase N-terminal domain-containing protein [Defluviitaleaceae bacterium]|nr:copper amine oxidase N-terminal domain-containing protein [Defluviitaleaceae bacterium]
MIKHGITLVAMLALVLTMPVVVYARQNVLVCPLTLDAAPTDVTQTERHGIQHVVYTVEPGTVLRAEQYSFGAYRFVGVELWSVPDISFDAWVFNDAPWVGWRHRSMWDDDMPGDMVHSFTLHPRITGQTSFTFEAPGRFLVRYITSGAEGTDASYLFVNFPGDAPAPPAAPTVSADISVIINGVTQSFEVPPRIIDGRTMLPLRAVGEALYMDVDFDRPTNTAILTTANATIRHVINTAEISVNGATQSFDVASTIVDGRTLVPVRMLAEAIGADVEWDATTRTAIITTN